MQYAWAMMMFKDADPNEVGAHIKELIQRHEGILTPEDVLDSALSTRSPIHRLFEWDDTLAAKQQRVRRAAEIVNNLVVAKGKKKSRTRAFVYIAIAARPGSQRKRLSYVDVREAMRDPQMAEEVVARAIKDLERWIGRYGAHRALDFVRGRVRSLKHRIEAEYRAVLTS